eukprot:755863-Hanusia_phi.AAC.1
MKSKIAPRTARNPSKREKASRQAGKQASRQAGRYGILVYECNSRGGRVRDILQEKEYGGRFLENFQESSNILFVHGCILRFIFPSSKILEHSNKFSIFKRGHEPLPYAKSPWTCKT